MTKEINNIVKGFSYPPNESNRNRTSNLKLNFLGHMLLQQLHTTMKFISIQSQNRTEKPKNNFFFKKKVNLEGQRVIEKEKHLS